MNRDVARHYKIRGMDCAEEIAQRAAPAGERRQDDMRSMGTDDGERHQGTESLRRRDVHPAD
jgi:hypothetical protein